MDWLKNMNDVIAHIEKNLQSPIAHEDLAKIAGCSVYEFSRIWSFMAGISLSEYIRRRRLSMAAFDIQAGNRVLDVALNYCYDSPTAFTRAFREIHGTSPIDARKGAHVKNHPPISFVLTIKGVDEMKFRIEKKDAFTIKGPVAHVGADGDLPASMFSSTISISHYPKNEMDDLSDTERKRIEDLPRQETKIGLHTVMHVDRSGTRLLSEVQPFYYTAAFDYTAIDGKTQVLMGTTNFTLDESVEYSKSIVPAAQWAVFSFSGEAVASSVDQAYARILTEWFPGSPYIRDESVPHMERFPFGSGAESEPWEIWMPVVQGLR